MDTICLDNTQFAKSLGIEYYCPENTNSIQLSFEYVKQQVEIDWALILLGIGSGYLEISCLAECDYKKADKLDLSSVLISQSEIDNHQISIESLKKITSHIDLQSWCISFEKLFFVVAKWLIENVDFNDQKYRYSLQILWDDFYLINIAHDNIFFPGEFNNEWFAKNAQCFLIEERKKIEKESSSKLVSTDEYQNILQAWKMRYYTGEIPDLINDYWEYQNRRT